MPQRNHLSTAKQPTQPYPQLTCHDVPMSAQGPRFLTPADVADILSVTPSQVLKFLRDRQLRGIKLPGKGEWRIEATALEEFIGRLYQQTHAPDASHADSAHP